MKGRCVEPEAASFPVLKARMPSPRRVLVVDDEADIRELLALTLQRMGLEADTAASTFEAEQYLHKQAL